MRVSAVCRPWIGWRWGTGSHWSRSHQLLSFPRPAVRLSLCSVILGFQDSHTKCKPRPPVCALPVKKESPLLDGAKTSCLCFSTGRLCDWGCGDVDYARIYQNSSHNHVQCVVYELYLTDKVLKREQDVENKVFEIWYIWKYLSLSSHTLVTEYSYLG